MEINLKIKFDKHHKTNTWDKSESFFVDAPSASKRRPHSPKSLRQEPKPAQKHARRESQPVIPASKPSTARKTSTSKVKLEKKYSTVKKPTTASKKPRRKGEQSGVEYESLRGSLPGLSGKKVLQRFEPLLSENQRIELINEKTVYYIGVGSGPGEDDLEGRYLWHKHEQVGYRYELLEGLGQGAFGEVIRAYDHKSGEMVGVKIVRAGREHMQLALN